MDAFSYLSVLLSIILGLAIAQVLQGYRSILLARGRVRVSAPVLIWSGLVLLFATQAWWASFGLRGRPEWDFLSFAVILLQMTLLYMLSAVIFPEVAGDRRVDLVDHFERHRRIFFGILIGMLVVSVTKDLVLDHHLPGTANLSFHAMFIATCFAGLLLTGSRTQLALAVVAVTEFLLYIALLFAKL